MIRVPFKHSQPLVGRNQIVMFEGKRVKFKRTPLYRSPRGSISWRTSSS